MSCLISFERCQSSCKEHGTSEHYKKLSTVGFGYSHDREASLLVHRLNRSATTRLLLMKKLKCPFNVCMFVYLYDQELNQA